MRLAIYLADPALRADVLAWAEAHGHAVLESLPEPPATWAGDLLFSLEAAVARLEPAAVLLDAATLIRARRCGADPEAVRAALGLAPSVGLPAPAFGPAVDPGALRVSVALLAVACVEEAATALGGLGEVAAGSPVPTAGDPSGPGTHRVRGRTARTSMPPAWFTTTGSMPACLPCAVCTGPTRRCGLIPPRGPT